MRERAPTPSPPPPLPALVSANPARWLTVFGPGAIVASLTIGTGELIFSTRGGVLFGYDVLFLFTVISLLKWALVVAAARQIVLTGKHPLERLTDFPGPRGWLPISLSLLAVVCIPIWISFHASVLGNLSSWASGSAGSLGGAEDSLWGAGSLVAVFALAFAGGYTALERVQLTVVAALLACAGITLILYDPDWLGIARGFIPSRLEYPPWLGETHPDIAAQPVWVETTRYVGVIGGAGYDYLAYVSFLREKAWGYSSGPSPSRDELERIAGDPRHPARLWTRAAVIDCSLSFLVVVLFSAVFVACGALVLGPDRQIPDDHNLLNLQARLVTELHPWLFPLYVAGAFLAMFGTLYGTLEVGLTMAAEGIRVAGWSDAKLPAVRRATLVYLIGAALALLVVLALYRRAGGEGRPPILLAVLTPANLFTGVLLCGILCASLLWMERRFLPRGLRMHPALASLVAIGAVAFVAFGFKGYWESESRGLALGGLGFTAIVSVAIALRLGRRGSTKG